MAWKRLKLGMAKCEVCRKAALYAHMVTIEYREQDGTVVRLKTIGIYRCAYHAPRPAGTYGRCRHQEQHR